MVDKATLSRLDDLAQRNERLEKKLQRVETVLSNTIAWIGQSAGSPLSKADIQLLLKDLYR